MKISQSVIDELKRHEDRSYLESLQEELDKVFRDHDFKKAAVEAEGGLIELEAIILKQLGRIPDGVKLVTSNGTWTFSND